MDYQPIRSAWRPCETRRCAWSEFLLGLDNICAERSRRSMALCVAIESRLTDAGRRVMMGRCDYFSCFSCWAAPRVPPPLPPLSRRHARPRPPCWRRCVRWPAPQPVPIPCNARRCRSARVPVAGRKATWRIRARPPPRRRCRRWLTVMRNSAAPPTPALACCRPASSCPTPGRCAAPAPASFAAQARILPEGRQARGRRLLGPGAYRWRRPRQPASACRTGYDAGRGRNRLLCRLDATAVRRGGQIRLAIDLQYCCRSRRQPPQPPACYAAALLTLPDISPALRRPPLGIQAHRA